MFDHMSQHENHSHKVFRPHLIDATIALLLRMILNNESVDRESRPTQRSRELPVIAMRFIWRRCRYTVDGLAWHIAVSGNASSLTDPMSIDTIPDIPNDPGLERNVA